MPVIVIRSGTPTVRLSPPPNVADGYWLMLAPLSPGEHTIQVNVRAPGTIFGTLEFEVITHLTVE